MLDLNAPKRRGVRISQGLRLSGFPCPNSLQVWEDYRKEDAEIHNGKVGPVGTSSRYDCVSLGFLLAASLSCRAVIGSYQVEQHCHNTNGILYSRVELDEELPAHGKHFCLPCSRYFISEAALKTHEATKPHKRRIKQLSGDRPHNQADADWAGGMGAPDNGPATMGMASMLD